MGEIKTLKSKVVSANMLKQNKNELVFSYLTSHNLMGFGGMSRPTKLAIYPSCSSGYFGYLALGQ